MPPSKKNGYNKRLRYSVLRGSSPCIGPTLAPAGSGPSPKNNSLARVFNLKPGDVLLRQHMQKLREIASQCLDFDVHIFQQDPMKREQFIHAASEQFPVLSNYTRAWPAYQYIQHYIWQRLYRLRRQRSMTSDLAQNYSPRKETEDHPKLKSIRDPKNDLASVQMRYPDNCFQLVDEAHTSATEVDRKPLPVPVGMKLRPRRKTDGDRHVQVPSTVNSIKRPNAVHGQKGMLAESSPLRSSPSIPLAHMAQSRASVGSDVIQQSASDVVPRKRGRPRKRFTPQDTAEHSVKTAEQQGAGEFLVPLKASSPPVSEIQGRQYSVGVTTRSRSRADLSPELHPNKVMPAKKDTGASCYRNTKDCNPLRPPLGAALVPEPLLVQAVRVPRAGQ